MISGFLQKLMFVKQFMILDGKIEILGTKHIMLAADALLGLQETDSTKTYDLVKDSVFKNMTEFVEHAKVYKALKDIALLDVIKLSKKIGGEEGMLKTLRDVFDIYGLGTMTILDLNNEKKTAFIRIDESSIAQAYINHEKKRSKTPECTITAAVLAGMFSFLFNKDVDCIEGKCLAKGDIYCEFAVK
ncbi:hypothetical protein HZA33_04445 [Candidatus Pacearchaeota archaeon]|nr:hypothetical protein [Candidatus Pacearchaeota archaeon]